MKLSPAQLRCLKRVRSTTVLAADVNGGKWRSWRWLFEQGLIEWSPLLVGRVELTFRGSETLDKLAQQEQRHARVAPSKRLRGK